MSQNKPDMTGLNQLDAAVLIEKLILINGMIQFGTHEEKVRAKNELAHLEKTLHVHLNQEAFEQAKRELGITDEDLNMPRSLQLF